ncbi:ADP,ATP carrier protein 1, mitochondrial-like protein [Tanacetum coccineum]
MGALSHIIKNEGAKSLFKSDGANIVRAIAGAVVLSRYDKLQLITLDNARGEDNNESASGEDEEGEEGEQHSSDGDYSSESE